MSNSTQAKFALVVGQDEALEMGSMSVPELETQGMLVEVQAATLCGTDIHLWHSAGPSMPYVPGHESCGIVVAINGERSDVTGTRIQVGDRIIWAYPFCGECFYCSVANQPTMCPNALRFGREPVNVYPHLLGGCATHQYVPPMSSVIKVPDAVPSELAASAGCALRTVMHGFERLGRVSSYETAVIQGSGPVGLYALAVAISRGFRRVLMIGAPGSRLEVARQWGAYDTLDLEVVSDQKDRKRWVESHTGGMGADVVIQCATGSAIPEGLDICRPGGRYLSIGSGSFGRNLEIGARALSGKMLTVIGVRSGEGRHFYEALQFLNSGGFPFEDMISGRYSLDSINDAFQSMKALTEIKAAIFPTS